VTGSDSQQQQRFRCSNALTTALLRMSRLSQLRNTLLPTTGGLERDSAWRSLGQSSNGPYYFNLATLNHRSSPSHEFIRLLKPRLVKDHLAACEIRTFSIDASPKDALNAPGYAALSYSWGDHAAVCSVQLYNGSKKHSFSISRDLREALAAVARLEPSKWLWVDALCIDQSSVEERSDQVQRMKDIYSRAQCVLVWLGKERGSQLGFSGLSRAGLTGIKIRDLLDQGQRVWWARLWVIQEISSCANVSVCIGERVTRWEDFVELFCSHETSGALLSIGELSKAREQDRKREVDRVIRAQGDMRLLQSMRTQVRAAHHGMSIETLLRSSLPSGVSDPLDRVYSLLGLAKNDVREEIAVHYEYGDNVGALWQDVVLCHIKTTSNLDILFNKWPKGQGSHPSWLPDFSSEGDPDRMSIPLDRYRASGSSATAENTSVYGSLMCVEAMKCSGVRKLGPQPLAAYKHPPGWGHTWQDYERVAVQALPDERSQQDSKHDGPNPPPKEDIIDLQYELSDWPAPYRDRPGLGRLFFTSLSRVGYVGWTAHDVQVGDLLIVPWGSKVPLIIRARPPHRDGSVPTSYILVGECYIQGWMHGEMLQLLEEGQLAHEIFMLV
jgi:hypothetical protein